VLHSYTFLVTMKHLLPLLLWFVALTTVAQAPTTTFILVRHAEKATDDPKDPSLSEAGKARAEQLKNLLVKSGVTAIYSTNFKRTRDTGSPLATVLGLEIKMYGVQTAETLVQSLLRDHAGGTLLVVGHSNTTPHIANALLGLPVFTDFDDSDYGNLLIVTATRPGDGKLIHLRF
jgi:2,3-bisphosphoglycerate-dependent phosphoglycerate mutase